MRVLSRLYHALRGSVFFSRCAYWSSHTFIRSVLISCLFSLIVGVLWKASHRGINATHCIESEALNRFESGNRYTRVCLDVLERKPSNRESLFRDPLHMLHARVSGSCFPTWTSRHRAMFGPVFIDALSKFQNGWLIERSTGMTILSHVHSMSHKHEVSRNCSRVLSWNF